MQPDFEKANEIYFRLGIIYKQQQKYNQSLEVFTNISIGRKHVLIFLQCFKYIVTDPPRPLTEEDIWFQIGHVHEQQKDVSCCQVCPPNGPTDCRNYSTTLQRQHTAVFWNEIQTMPRFCSSSVGCIISRAQVSVAKSTLSSTWKSLSVQVRTLKRMRLFADSFTNVEIRQLGRTKLVPPWPLLHVTAKVFEGV